MNKTEQIHDTGAVEVTGVNKNMSNSYKTIGFQGGLSLYKSTSANVYSYYCQNNMYL